MISDAETGSSPFPTDNVSADRAREDNALARKLGRHLRFSRSERDALQRTLGLNVRQVSARTNFVEEGELPMEISVILQGWACRYKTTADGKRQIVAFYVPGDVCDFNVFMMEGMDSSIEAIEGAQVAGISRSALSLMTREHPRISQALWWESLVATSIQREWIVNIGQRKAKQRMAHLLCELLTRLGLVGLADSRGCRLPLTQSDLGRACGLTSEHANRTLQELRGLGLLQLADGMLAIADWEDLVTFAGFDPAYLHVRAPGGSGAGTGSSTAENVIRHGIEGRAK